MKLTTTQKAYLAGLIDGEGYIYFRRRSGDSKWWGGVQINITNKKIISTLLEWVGGGTPIWNKGSENKKWMPRYRWEIGAKDSEKLLNQIKRYMIIKKENAELYLKYRKTFKGRKYGRGVRVSSQVEKERFELVKQYREMMAKQTVRRGGYLDVTHGIL